MNATGQPRRHDLAWIHPGADLPAALPEAARRWLEAGNPAVVCRRDAEPERVRLGVALPAAGSGEKPGRCAFEVEPGALAETRPPLTLEAVIPSAPAAWQPALEALCRERDASGVCWRVFGSLAWRHLHGGAGFVRELASDVDLLCAPDNLGQLDAALALLATAATPPLDGEIRFPGDLDVSWREWVRAPDEVLVKQLHRVSLQPIAGLRESLVRRAKIPCA